MPCTSAYRPQYNKRFSTLETQKKIYAAATKLSTMETRSDMAKEITIEKMTNENDTKESNSIEKEDNYKQMND